MARSKKSDIPLTPQCQAALARMVASAHRMASDLTGDPLEEETGLAESGRSMALSMAMVFYLLRLDPRDIHAAFFAEGSMNRFAYAPPGNGPYCEPLLDGLL